MIAYLLGSRLQGHYRYEIELMRLPNVLFGIGNIKNSGNSVRVNWPKS